MLGPKLALRQPILTLKWLLFGTHGPLLNMRKCGTERVLHAAPHGPCDATSLTSRHPFQRSRGAGRSRTASSPMMCCRSGRRGHGHRVLDAARHVSSSFFFFFFSFSSEGSDSIPQQKYQNRPSGVLPMVSFRGAKGFRNHPTYRSVWILTHLQDEVFFYCFLLGLVVS